MSKNIMALIDGEINASQKNEKPIYLELFKDNNTFKGVFSQKIEGEFILASKGLEDTLVQVKWDSGLVTVIGVESDEVKINAFLLKDNSAILRAVKSKLAREELPVEPSFLIGPPGTGKSTVIVDSDSTYMARICTNDGSVLITCSGYDGKMILTK